MSQKIITPILVITLIIGSLQSAFGAAVTIGVVTMLVIWSNN